MDFLPLGYRLDAFGLLQEMMIKLAVRHQIVAVDLLKLADQILLPNYQLNHLLCHPLPNLLYRTLQHIRAVLPPQHYIHPIQPITPYQS